MGAVVAGKYSEHDSGTNEREAIENAVRILASSPPEKCPREISVSAEAGHDRVGQVLRPWFANQE